MKKLLYGLLVCIPLVSIAAFACPDGKGEKHADRMVEELELNDEQFDQFRDAMQTKCENMRAFHEEQHQEMLKQLETFLTAEQMQEFQEMRERRIQHKKRHL
ncbi:MAG: hypothetical protein ACR2PU_03255 [Gammaproteobacteria bacterium]